MTCNQDKQNKPEILAPAGDKDSFLSAIAAQADSIYCGLKNFSARMQAANFSLDQLGKLVSLAEKKNIRTYLTFNTLIKPNEISKAGQLLDKLINSVRPHGFIIQDLAILYILKDLGFTGDIHLSTLAHFCLPSNLADLNQIGINRVVLPRELDLEEIKLLNQSCPTEMALETFVHGALCYGISGRCYWSSYLGGKSGLRGQCVQPCRRLYSFKGSSKRYFSCLDLSLDVLSKTLLDIPQIKAWKIEGRKKGPHYIYYTVKAYQLFRDQPQDPQAKKTALELLANAMGRQTSHFFFLPQRPHLPIKTNLENVSGQLVGHIRKNNQGNISIRPNQKLLPEDLLRIGYQDNPGHFIYKVSKYIPKGKNLSLAAKNKPTAKGIPVFLIDRKEPELKNLISRENNQLIACSSSIKYSEYMPDLPPANTKCQSSREMHVYFSQLPSGKRFGQQAIWLKASILNRVTRTLIPKIWFWLPPVIWPKEEKKFKQLIANTIHRGGKKFVLNSPWQIGLFESVKRKTIWAGPYCNLANQLAMQELKDMGFSGAFVSPELNQEDVLSLPQKNPLPLGIVIKGYWPFCISRILSPELKLGSFLESPKKELLWIDKQDQNIFLYPNWELDLSSKKSELEQAGYYLLAYIYVQLPPKLPKSSRRTSTFNWKLDLR